MAIGELHTYNPEPEDDLRSEEEIAWDQLEELLTPAEQAAVMSNGISLPDGTPVTGLVDGVGAILEHRFPTEEEALGWPYNS